MRRAVVVGDALVDRDLVGTVDRVSPDAPVPVVAEAAQHTRPGGAALAAALMAADGRPVTLVSALGRDAPGRQLAALLADGGVDLVDLQLAGPTPEKIRVRSAGQSMMRIDRGGPPAPVRAPAGTLGTVGDLLARSDVLLVADYGRGVTGVPRVTAGLAAAAGRVPVVWDPHPRGAVPVPGVTVATPNLAELTAAGAAASGTSDGDPSLGAVARRARSLAETWRARSLAVTMGRRGTLWVEPAGDGASMMIPADEVRGGDPCGAGDRFAATAAALLADGALPSEAVVGATAAATAFVAAGGASALSAAPGDGPGERRGDPFELAARHRAAGGTVVATGGCFDLLHAGHVALLRSARALGTCLVVCLNSDASARRLKGPGRPVVPASDRAEVLRALASVDAVAVFEQDTPGQLLERLRPDLFVKGGDYAGMALPETEVLARWGGQTVVVPYLDGRSTSQLLVKGAQRAS